MKGVDGTCGDPSVDAYIGEYGSAILPLCFFYIFVNRLLQLYWSI